MVTKIFLRSAWIINDTVRGNILFERSFDYERYYQIIKACALIDDLADLVNQGVDFAGAIDYLKKPEEEKSHLDQYTSTSEAVKELSEPESGHSHHVETRKLLPYHSMPTRMCSNKMLIMQPMTND